MEGDMDMDVFKNAQDNEGFEGGDEETSFIDVDEDYYDNLSRAVASDTLENYDWGSQERYEAARSKYIKEHGTSNIPSWMDLSDQVLSPLYYEDPLTTIKGAEERIIELEPNTNLDEIQLIKKDGKIHIRSVYKQRGKLGALKPLFTKDGEISADLYRYSWFKDATRSKLQELKETDERVAALNKVAVLSKELEDYKQRLEDQLDIGSRLAKNRDATIEKYSTLKEKHAALQEQLKEAQRSLEEASPGNNKELSDRLLKTLKEKENTLEEIKELNQTLYKNDRNYMRQKKLLLDAQRRDKESDSKRIAELLNQKKWYMKEANAARVKLDSALRLINLSKEEINDFKTTIDGSLIERKQLIQDIKIKEEQLRQMKQTIEDLEHQAELQREFIRDRSKTEEEIEAAKEKLEGIQERIAELESKKENLERVLGLTRREKILRYLKRAGLGLAAAGAIASIITFIMNALDKTGSVIKKLGRQVANLGKKMVAAIPGLLGSVLSLIFRTGGELLKFLGNNIWILVVAVVAVVLKSLTEKSSRR